MDYSKKGNLKDYILSKNTQSSLSNNECIKLFCKILKSYQVLVENKIYFTNMKLENILLMDNETENDFDLVLTDYLLPKIYKLMRNNI